MSTQTALGHSFPTPCKRCGGALYRQVDYCPYCGAVHPLEAGTHSRTATPASRAGALSHDGPRLDTDPAPSDNADPTAFAAAQPEAKRAEVALRTALVSPEMPVPQFEEPPYSTGGSRVTIRRILLAILAVVVIGLAYVAYALFSDSGYSDDSGTDQTTSTGNQDARTSTGTIAPFAPSQTAHSPGTVKPAAPGGSANPTVAANSTKTVPAALAPPAVAAVPAAPVAAPAAPPVAVAPVKPAAPQFRDASQALQAAHLAFNANDLSTAQAALASAQALQPGNPDAQSMASELRPLTARRDAALQAAQTCVSQQSWACARQHANEALTIDTGNETAKAILQRVIRETGWAPLKTDAATGAAAQGKPAAQQAQLQTSSSKGGQANADTTATAPRAGATGSTATDTSSADARARSIVDSGWSHAPAPGAKAPPATSPGQ